MKREQLEQILQVSATKGSPTAQYARFVPALPDLYTAGCSVKQLEDLFGVSKKFVRTHLTKRKKAGNFDFRPSGPRDPAAIPKPERIIAILKKHGLTLDDLPGPRAKSPKNAADASPKPTPKRGKKKP